MKKTVNFIGEAKFFTWEGVVPKDLEKYASSDGLPMAWVYATNHPKLGRGNVRTSVVVKQYKNGNFDTLNTKYKKVLDKQ
jgi:hypothetical protein